MIMKKVINVSTKLSDGREISLETGKLAKQADGSVVLTMGKTMILATVVAKEEVAFEECCCCRISWSGGKSRSSCYSIR